MSTRSALARALLVLGCGTSAQAAMVDWVGPNGGAWDLPSHWSPAVPGAADDVRLGAFDTVFRTGTSLVRSMAGTGRLSVTGGDLSVTAASSIGALALSGGRLSGSGALTVSGPAELVSSTNGVGLGGTITFAGTTDWIRDPSEAAEPDPRLELAPQAVINNEGTWRVRGGQRMTSDTAAGQRATFNNRGRLVLDGRSADLSEINFTNTGTIELNNSWFITPSFVNEGLVTGPGTVRASDSLSTFGPGLVNAGRVAPGGADPGRLLVQGNFSQTAAGSLDIRLSAGSGWDNLWVTDATQPVTLAGSLNLSCVADCNLSFAQSFLIYQGTRLSGRFDAVNWTGFPPGMTFSVSYNPFGLVFVNVAVVPEPGTWALMLAGGAWVLSRRKRHRA